MHSRDANNSASSLSNKDAAPKRSPKRQKLRIIRGPNAGLHTQKADIAAQSVLREYRSSISGSEGESVDTNESSDGELVTRPEIRIRKSTNRSNLVPGLRNATPNSQVAKTSVVDNITPYTVDLETDRVTSSDDE